MSVVVVVVVVVLVVVVVAVCGLPVVVGGLQWPHCCHGFEIPVL